MLVGMQAARPAYCPCGCSGSACAWIVRDRVLHRLRGLAEQWQLTETHPNQTLSLAPLADD